MLIARADIVCRRSPLQIRLSWFIRGKLWNGARIRNSWAFRVDTSPCGKSKPGPKMTLLRRRPQRNSCGRIGGSSVERYVDTNEKFCLFLRPMSFQLTVQLAQGAQARVRRRAALKPVQLPASEKHENRFSWKITPNLNGT